MVSDLAQILESLQLLLLSDVPLTPGDWISEEARPLRRALSAAHDRVGVDVEMYRALCDGYLEKASGFLNAFEVEHMAFAARIVTLTIGMRFLADHIKGDVYFKIEREGHNLDRARVQLRMVDAMERRL